MKQVLGEVMYSLHSMICVGNREIPKKHRNAVAEAVFLVLILAHKRHQDHKVDELDGNRLQTPSLSGSTT